MAAGRNPTFDATMDISFPTDQNSPEAHAAIRQLADTAKTIVWMTDAAGVFTYVNRSASFLFDKSKAIHVSSWMQCIHTDDRERVTAVVAQEMAARAEYQVEYRIRRSDGSIRWMMGTAAPRFAAGGGFLGYNGSVIDVTDRHEALENLARSEAEHRLLTENSSDMISHHALDGTLLYVSPSVRRAFGYAASELIGTDFFAHVHPDDAQLIRDEIFKQIETGTESGLIEFRKRHKDGRYIWIGTKAQILVNPVTKEATGIVAVSRDVTFERQAREELGKREERFRSLANLSSDWYWEMDENHRFTFVSEGARRLIGARPQRILGRSREDLARHLSDQGLAECFAKIMRHEPFREIRCAVRRPAKGMTRYASISGEPVFEAGVFKGYRGVGRDITGEIEIAEKLAQLADENRALIENSLDMLAVFDAQGRFLRVNEASREITGYEPSELLGRCYLDFVAADDARKTETIITALSARKTRVRNFENRWVRKDGDPVHLSWNVRWSGERQLGYAVARDVSETYRTQAELNQTKDRLYAMVENIGDAFFAVDSQWRILYANRKTAEFVNRAQSALVGRIMWEAVPEILGSSVFPEYQKAMATRATSFFDAYYEPADAWVEVRVYPYENGLTVYFHDISARREAEQAIRSNEHRLRELIEMTPAGYVLADAQGVLADVNPALCAMSGYRQEELIGQPLARLFPVCPFGDALSVTGGATSVQTCEAAIRHNNGHLVYVLVNANIRRDANGHALSLTAFATNISERKQAEARLEQLATHDTLTGLPNRALLNDRLQQMLDSAPRGASIAVMFIDLDRFKEVNDSIGHESGDILLREVGRRLQKNLRPSDLVARLGGDEFVVVTHCSRDADSAAAVADKLLAALAAPADIAGYEVFVAASIGISMYPRDGKTKELLFQNADTAMYRAKGAGRNGYRFFEEEMSVAAKTRMMLEQSLRRALERGEFELHYQPRIHLRTMAIVGMEALIRWHHPHLGEIPPMQFIPIAEERALVEPIGRWVLEQACAQTRRLMDRFGRSLRVSVNLSARQLKCTDIVAQVDAALRKADLPPHLLELELTESAIIDDIEASARVLEELKRLGIALSVDDFGTGYSGLAYLRRFPLDTLKLDRSFVTQEDHGISGFKFIKAFVDLAHTLNLSVVAEGVETNDTLQMLRDAACDEAQGFLLARPLSLQAFETYLSRLPAVDSRRKSI
jgi:diguanylate cyclase (GGDEF)-like protein/PAS domain S-box-containing protein